MLVEPGFAQHFTGIAANGYWNSGLEIMMIVQGEPVWEFGNAALIVGDMAKVFANVFELAFEAAYGHGIKINHAGLTLDVFIIEGERVFGNNPVIESPYVSHYTSEVFDIQGTAKAFAE